LGILLFCYFIILKYLAAENHVMITILVLISVKVRTQITSDAFSA